MLLIRIKSISRFIKNQNRWIVNECLGKAGSLPESLGKGIDDLFAGFLE